MRVLYCLITIVLASSIVTGSPQAGETAVPPPWETILAAHRAAWTKAPASVLMMGVSTRGKVTEPLKITATAQEETVVELDATRKEVSTPQRFFKEDGEKSSRQNALAGFTQLDVTGVFFLAQLRARSPRTDAPVLTTFQNTPAWKIHVHGDRVELHYRQLPVNDEFDLYVDQSGALVGIARTFYKEAPLFTFTMELAFSDYRTGEVPLLPHRIERYIKGHKIETMLVDSYTFDVPVVSTLFDPRRSTR